MHRLESILRRILEGRRLPPFPKYGPQCVWPVSEKEFSIADTALGETPLVDKEEATAVFSNPTGQIYNVMLIDDASNIADPNNGQRPSVCDFVITTDNQTILVLGELKNSSENNLYSGLRRNGTLRVGQHGKAVEQLKSTLQMISEDYGAGDKRRCVVSFRIRPIPGAVVNRLKSSFSSIVVNHKITRLPDDTFPGWKFFSHPYPEPFPL